MTYIYIEIYCEYVWVGMAVVFFRTEKRTTNFEYRQGTAGCQGVHNSIRFRRYNEQNMKRKKTYAWRTSVANFRK